MYQVENEVKFGANANMVVEQSEVSKLCTVPECRALKVKGVHHCSKCKKCVYQMDHHCPWTDNCVGIGTFKYFVLFGIYVNLQTLIGILVIVKNKLMNNDEKNLNHLSFNPVWMLLDFDTLLLREIGAYFYSFVFSNMREWLFLPKVGSDGQYIWKEGEDRQGWVDQVILQIANLLQCFALFVF